MESIQDLTSNHQIHFPEDSLITTYSGGLFGSAGTAFQGVGNSMTGPSTSGPFTCGVLPSGVVVCFPRITFIAIQNGGFGSGASYLGGLAPSDDVCSGGCGVYVAAGVTLSTADLNGELDLNIVEIDVAAGGFFELGTPGSNNGFKFKHGVTINVLGTLSFVASGGGIYMIGGNGITSSINILTGGEFTSVVVTFIQEYDILTGANIGPPFILATIIIGPDCMTVSTTVTVTNCPGMKEY